MTALEDMELVELDEGAGSGHPPRSLPLYVAPATRDDFSSTANTMRMSLDPIACWRINDKRFEFDSSFINADARLELRLLAKMIKSAPQAPLSIFGHADPTGKDTYNLVLAQRRARSLHCILTRDLDEWKDLYDKPFGGDDWKAHKVESLMLSAIGYSPDIEDVKQFQRDYGLGDDGSIGKDSRPVLVKRYMDWLCPVTLKKEAFLGGGKDKKGRGDYQSCGEFNAVFLLNDQETNDPTDQKHLKRDAKNSVNRRVLVYFYQPGTIVEQPAWPCPAAPRSEGEAASAKTECTKRFWKDSKDRITPLKAPLVDPNANPPPDPPPDPPKDTDKLSALEQTSGNREFKERQRTMACRFYHRMAGWSPCEGGKEVKHWPIRLVTTDGAPPPQKGKPLANIPFVATVVGQPNKRTVGSTSDDGVLRIREHAGEHPTTFEVRLRLDKDVEKVLIVHAGDLKAVGQSDASDDTTHGIWQRLFNLGYTEADPRLDPFSANEFQLMVNAFQAANAISEPSWTPAQPVSDATKKKVHDIYENADTSSGGGGTGGSTP